MLCALGSFRASTFVKGLPLRSIDRPSGVGCDGVTLSVLLCAIRRHTLGYIFGGENQRNTHNDCNLRFSVFLEDQDDGYLRRCKPGNSPGCNGVQAVRVHLPLVCIRGGRQCHHSRLLPEQPPTAAVPLCLAKTNLRLHSKAVFRCRAASICARDRQGWRAEEILAGLAAVLPKNVFLYIASIPNLAALGALFVLQGGTQKNIAVVKAEVDFIHNGFRAAGKKPEIIVHEFCGDSGAIGAAVESLRLWRKGQQTMARGGRLARGI
jgi:hypothetical protein